MRARCRDDALWGWYTGIMSRYELVIFDFDGTIADTGGVICESFAAAVLGTPAQREAEAFRSVLGQPLEYVHDLLRQAVPEYDDSRAVFVARYRERYNRISYEMTRLFPGVKQLISGWKSPLAIASSKPTQVLQRQIDGLRIGEHFAHIQGTDGFPYKPNPAILHRVWERVPASARGTVFVGDAVTDIQAGRAAGVVTIGITHGAHGKRDLLAAGAEHVVDDLDGLERLLR
jgi:phosphoglycolate phosphatase